MADRISLIGVAVLTSLFAMGCDQVSQGQTPFQAERWTTYTSPDKRVSFEYPSNLNLTVLPRQDESEPQLALLMSSSDESLGLTLVMRISDEPMSDYCQYMLKTCADSNTTATSPPEAMSLNGAEGFRQEFRSGSGILADNFVALALESESVYVIFSCSHRAVRRGELEPICQRIVNSLTITPSVKP